MGNRSDKNNTNKSFDNAPNNSSDITVLLEKRQPYAEFNVSSFKGSQVDGMNLVNRIQGSLLGLAIGDALGASVEFRPHSYLKDNPVNDMQSGGTWGLSAGQWTDDTSMALCSAASFIVSKRYDSYDHFSRFKRWFRDGYMSSTGTCFDIGKSTRESILQFEKLEQDAISSIAQQKRIKESDVTILMRQNYLNGNGRLELGSKDAAGNGALMRLAPLPAFFHSSHEDMQQYVVASTKLTHGDQRAIDASIFYADLIWHALSGKGKQEIFNGKLWSQSMYSSLDGEVQRVVNGSYKNKKGYEDGIRGKGFVVDAFEAALWALWNDEGSFEKGVLLAVNLGDDTDTTAAIYGQLAGALYGIDAIKTSWIQKLFASDFIKTIGRQLYIEGKNYAEKQKSDKSNKLNQSYKQTNTNTTKIQSNAANQASPQTNPSGVGYSNWDEDQ